ncbi:class I SAM-dependent methyltransferase [Aquincola sp. MAHUQ-54]|uniref:Class I SAM-dependent methyltransferase n=1 Tax=Aquincola agrisoli TaxID=3119538 RepID=A0AAW9Q9U4_9BURK
MSGQLHPPADAQLGPAPAPPPGTPHHGHADAYDDWATLYDETVGIDYVEPQRKLLERVLLPGLPAGAQLLDLCCGSGLLIRPLLQAGYRVTGLDGSAGMLACARRNAPQAAFLLDDARHFDLAPQFDGAFSTSASLNHIDTLEDLCLVFERVHAALKPGAAFVFDLNHPAQLARWWRGVPYEGELRADVGWLITPRYDAATRRGAFRVTTFRPPADGAGGLLRPLKRLLYGVLSRPRFIGLRLALLQRLGRIEPRWRRQDVDYPITGHDLGEVRAALLAAGFASVRLETIDGSTDVDDRHAAHFIAVKGGG